MSAGKLYRLAAFSEHAEGGNPAGVWLGEQLPDAETMQQIAAQVGYSETAFVVPSHGWQRTIRYYSPEAEVPFCGHASIATGVLLGQTHGDGQYQLQTRIGDIPVTVRSGPSARQASLTSVLPAQAPASTALIEEACSILGWQIADLSPDMAPVKAYAGAWHLVLAVSEAGRLASLDYDVDRLKTLLLREGLTTLQLVWRESAAVFHARNPFPAGAIREDPATGAAAAALGGYLRDAGLIAVPAEVVIYQGAAMGRPSTLHLHIPAHGGVVVTGTAVAIDGD